MDNDFKNFLNGIRDKIKVDRYNLEVEAENQPLLVDEVGRFKAEYRRSAKESKDECDRILANEKLKIRMNPSDHGFEKKPTNDEAECKALVSKEYQEALEIYRISDEQWQAMEALYEGVVSRKSLIRECVSLYVHDYYSNVNKDMTMEKDILHKIGKQAIIEEMNKETNVQEN